MNNHTTKSDAKSDAQSDPDAEADRLQHDIEAIRDNLGGLVGELDHRRHDALNVRLQLRRHAIPLLAGAAAVLGLVGGLIALRVVRRRRRATLPARLGRLRLAVRRMIDSPDRVAETAPNPGRKILTAGGTAAAAVLARRVAARMIRS